MHFLLWLLITSFFSLLFLSFIDLYRINKKRKGGFFYVYKPLKEQDKLNDYEEIFPDNF